ncbi:MAG: sulfotransferase family protein [Phycisphaerales bacterium]
MLDRLDRLLPLPFPHFMAFAPLDVWARMLARAGAWRRISPRYALRIAGGLFTSALGTLLTLPERFLVGVTIRLRPPRDVKVLCILGYFRSGTTHLHYMLSCDPSATTPRWYQVLAPQGFVLSWAFLRWFLVPFLASTRPQDDVAIGPEWPAEDDFALCNWSLSSSMPGRMVLPAEWNTWSAMHNLDGVGESDLARWRDHVRAFAWKVRTASCDRRRIVLLKNPSHTGRISELVRAFGPDNIRFIHVSRDPAAVVRSNIAMHRRFGPYLLQPHPGDDVVRARIVEEYDATERRFLAESASLPDGVLARVRYQDLVADPVGVLRSAYARLGLEWSDGLRTNLGGYLRSVSDYRAASAGDRPRAQTADIPPQLEWMLQAFGHDRPAVPRDDGGSAVAPVARTAWRSNLVIFALLWAAAWIGVSRLAGDRLDWLVWPTGAALGSLALRGAGRGSARLGLAAGALTLLTFLVVAYPATAVAFYREREPMPFADVWDSTRDGLIAVNNLVWVFLGAASAYRLASRRQAAAPGA